MGSGSTAYRVAIGEAMAIQAHEKAMIPIIEQRGEMELELQARQFEQKYAQSEKLGTLPDQIEAAERAMVQPVFMATTTAAPAIPKKVIFAAIAIGIYLFLR